MKLLRKLFVIAALLCFLCPVEPTGFGQQQVKAPTISWYVRFYPANSDYVEVTLNATEFAPKYLVRDARVSVEFRNKNGTAIGKGNFDFTDGRIHELTGGGTYRRYFKHDFKSAASVFGDQLKYAIWEVGHGVGAPRPIFGSFETLLSLREHENIDEIIGATPDTTPDAFNGQFRLFINGQEEGVLIIEHRKAQILVGLKSANDIRDYLAGRFVKKFSNYPSQYLSIEGNHIVAAFDERSFAGTPIDRLDGYLSTLSADSMAGTAWRRGKPFGFCALRLQIVVPGER